MNIYRLSSHLNLASTKALLSLEVAFHKNEKILLSFSRSILANSEKCGLTANDVYSVVLSRADFNRRFVFLFFFSHYISSRFRVISK